MIVFLIKLALALTTPHSVEWITEQGHVRCFDALDRVSVSLADSICTAEER